MPTLLLIDDHKLVLEALSYILQDAGFEVITSTSGQEGLQIALTRKPNVIITDYHMPKMTGMDVLHAVRNHPDLAIIPVVILTLEDDPETRKQFLASGANAYVTKSQPADALIGAIKDSLQA